MPHLLLLTALVGLRSMLQSSQAPAVREDAGGQASCWCANASLCLPLTTPAPSREVLGFVDTNSTWPRLDYNVMTTASVFFDGFHNDLDFGACLL